MVYLSSNTSTQEISDKKSWLAIWLFCLLNGSLLLIGIGAPLVFLYPASAFCLGVFLYYRSSHLYIGLVWWLTFAGPLIRKLIDYHSGYVTPGPWGFVPALIPCISMFALFKHGPTAHAKGGLPYIFVFAAIAYAALIGLYQNPANALFNGLLSWLGPVAFSFYLFINWRDYPKHRQAFRKAFLWGVLFLGFYGLYQFVSAPAWDVFWMKNIDAGSFGQPEPFGIRVYSSMGAPQVFANTILAGLLLLFCESSNPVSYVSISTGYLAFILTMARSVWLASAIGIPLFLLTLKPKFQIRMIFVGVIFSAVVAISLLSWDRVYDLFYERFESFFDLDSDISLNARQEGYAKLWSIAVTQFLGQGIGFSWGQYGSEIGGGDSAIFPLMFTFGWTGGAAYSIGFLMLFLVLLTSREASADVFMVACRAIVITMFAQIGLNAIFQETFGMLLWGFLGIGLAGQKHALFSKQNFIKKLNLMPEKCDIKGL